MKKWLIAMFLVLAVGLFTPLVVEARSITFRWEQPGGTSDLAGWKFFSKPENGTTYTQIGTFPFDGTELATYEGTITSPELDALPAGVYVFVATAHDTEGLESAHSNETNSHTLNGGPAPPDFTKGIRLTLTENKDEHIMAYKVE